MEKGDLNDEYLEWMCQLVHNEKCPNQLSYRKLLANLHTIEFIYILGMDGNRAEDGVDLRYRFGYENAYDGDVITAYIDGRPCSVLEMLIALALRCEEHIMDDPDVGNRTGLWFWNMIKNLGLMSMHDANFDINHTNTIISNFLNRKYEKNGKGGLFTVNRCNHDLRTIEIWYQMCWYLDDILMNKF